MTSGEVDAARAASNGKAQFLRWEIAEPRGESPHILAALGPVRVKFTAQVNAVPKMTLLGLNLFDAENRLVWGFAKEQVELRAGANELEFVFPMLPLRPGVYSWSIGVWDDEGCMDRWEAVPAMIVATPSYQHWDEHWNGVLNMPCELRSSAAARQDANTPAEQ
jgi:hypothetical protein